MNMRILVTLVILCLSRIEWYSNADSSLQGRYVAVVPTHSNFLKSQYFSRAATRSGRHEYVWCAKNVSICHDKEKNPLGGTTCCWGKFCKDVTYDKNHCGGCGNACGYGLSCCGGRCVDLNNNKHHCGSCDKECPRHQRCSFGMCDYSGGYSGCGYGCGYGMSCCGGKCVDLHNNRDHCGSCDKQCPRHQKCWFGMCHYGSGY